MIWEAYKDRATDIHFEPAEDELRIRYRIDGILHQTPMPPQLKRFQAALISRIKVMSGMNISEKRLPQDGRINVRIKGEEIDIRVSTVPTVYGESVSLRLLTRGKIFLSLDKLGFSPLEEQAIREIACGQVLKDTAIEVDESAIHSDIHGFTAIGFNPNPRRDFQTTVPR